MTNKELIEAHQNSTMFCSFFQQMKDSSTTYNQIIEKGFDIVPDILKYLQESGGGISVIMLLMEITQENPYTPESINSEFVAYDVDETIKTWLDWGKRKKYI